MYLEMHGLDQMTTMYQSVIKSDKKPIRASIAKYAPMWALKSSLRLIKLLNAGFIMEVQYPIWLANNCH